MRFKRSTLLGCVLAIAAFGLDQLAKGWAHARVSHSGVIAAFDGLNIIATTNTGVAFSLAQGLPSSILTGVGIALTSVFCILMIQAQTSLHAAGLGLAIGGAMGNVADRLRLGSVRDFIDVYWQDHHWPAFNLADAVIVTGLAIVLLFPVRPLKADTQ